MKGFLDFMYLNVVLSNNLELNIDKCSCLRIGPRFDRDCSAIYSFGGSVIAPVTELRYLEYTFVPVENLNVHFIRQKPNSVNLPMLSLVNYFVSLARIYSSTY